jgi:hypothetical protein
MSENDPNTLVQLWARSQKDSFWTFQNIVSVGWSSSSTLFGFLGAVESIAAASAAAAGTSGAIATMSVATKFSVFTMPISAFLLGASIRSWIDDKNEEADKFADATRSAIFLFAAHHAAELHFRRFPNSSLKQANSPLPLLITGRSSAIRWTARMKHAWSILSDDRDKVRNARKGGFGGSQLFWFCRDKNWFERFDIKEWNASPGDVWKAYSMGRFVELRYDLLNILGNAENGL